MQSIEHAHNPDSLYGVKQAEEQIEQVPMHPDDFEAQLAWVMAKRFHELVLGKARAENPVHYSIVG